jgi:O-antigen/teichoic acid export membrane protein
MLISRRSYGQRFAILFGGNALANLIVIAVSPLLARLYDPPAFGMLADMMAVVGLVAVAVHGRYHLAILVAPSQREAEILFLLSSLLGFIMSVTVGGIVAFSMAHDRPSLGKTSFVICAIALTIASAQLDIFSFWRSYRHHYAANAQNAILRSTATAMAQVALSAGTATGIVWGALVGAFVALCEASYNSLRRDGRLLGWPGILTLAAALRLYSAYPLYSMPQSLLASASWNLLPLVLFRYAGAETAGYYWLTYRCLMAPYNVLDASYRQATLSIIASADGKGSHRR